MRFKKIQDKHILKIEKGEEIIGSMKAFCKKQNINMGTITGIGAVNKAVIGFFETKTKRYHPIKLEKDYEVCSFLGNISSLNGEPYIHAHVVLSDNQHKCIGGHLSSAVVSATFEAAIFSIKGEVKRVFSEDIGLNLYDF